MGINDPGFGFDATGLAQPPVKPFRCREGTPDALEVAKPSSTLVNIAKNVVRRSGELFDTFLGAAAESAGKEVGKVVGWGMFGILGIVLWSAQSWLSLIL
ncbi:hypothetical protein [Pelagibacterium sp.]|uniref:hypothetical protein n=1 Tax=Pelagibacterium sp. TaxID=1967288 RepID=UPI003A955ABD